MFDVIIAANLIILIPLGFYGLVVFSILYVYKLERNRRLLI